MAPKITFELLVADPMARRIPHSRLVIVEDAGHVPVITRPAQVVQAIGEFFDANPTT